MNKKWFAMIFVAILLGIYIESTSLTFSDPIYWIAIIGGNLIFQLGYNLCKK